MKIQVEFEVSDKITDFGEAKGARWSLHEALCKAIHEEDPAAITWLRHNVLDTAIDFQDGDKPRDTLAK